MMKNEVYENLKTYDIQKGPLNEDDEDTKKRDRKILAYLRVSILDQMIESQRDVIYNWAKNNGLIITEWIRLNISTRAKPKDLKRRKREARLITKYRNKPYII